MKATLTLVLVVAASALPCAAQCADFEDRFAAVAGVGGIGSSVTRVSTFAAFDDGGGRALFAAGVFADASGVAVNGLAKWSGTQWSNPFPPTSPGFEAIPSYYVDLRALRSWDDGGGEYLYVGGIFARVDGVNTGPLAKWDGTTWSSVGGGVASPPYSASVSALLPWDDGTGDALYVAGYFTQAGGVTVNHLARWNGTSWSALATGLDAGVNAVEVHDDGSGPALYAGGHFLNAGGVPCSRVAKWNGSSWSPLGAGFNGNGVFDLASFDDGTGPALYACGAFNQSGNTPLNSVARWKNGQWTAITPLYALYIYALEVFDDGSGPALYASGSRTASGSPWKIAKLVGSSWVDVTTTSYYAFAVESVDLGAGEQLYIGGYFDRVSDVLCSRVARFDGQSWHALGTGGGRANSSESMVAHDINGVASVCADSGRTTSTNSLAESVMSWNGAGWDPVGAESDRDVHVLATHDDGSGARLYAGGDFNSFGGASISAVAMFDGSAWQPVGVTALSWTDIVWALQSWMSPSGPRLVAGGEFVTLGGAQLWFIAAWDGSTWSPFANGMNDHVLALGVFGGELYAAGKFTQADVVPAAYIAKWGGSQWNALGAGLDGTVWTMLSFDDGTGPALYVGGEFTHAGGVLAKRIARWDGSQWSALGAGFNSTVNKLVAFDDGSGPKLFAGGRFATSPSSTPFVARWDGSTWSALDPTLNGEVFSMAVVDHANGESSLFLGGNFTTAGGATSLRVAEYERSFPCPPVAYCTAKTNSLGCVPSIYSTGAASLSGSTLRVRASSIVSNKNGVMFWGLAPSASPFQGGTRCVHAPFVRTPFQSSGGNAPPDDCSGTFAYFFGASYMTSFSFAPGDRIYCQYWSRDPASPSTTNLTDALSFLVEP